MTRSDLIAVLALALAAVALFRSGPGTQTERPLLDRASTGSADGTRTMDVAALEERERRLDEQWVRLNEGLEVLDERRAELERLEASLAARLSSNDPPVDAGDGPGSNAAAARLHPRYVSFKVPPEVEISVSQDEDGSVRVLNRDPELAFTPMVIEAEQEDGSVDRIVIEIPPVER